MLESTSLLQVVMDSRGLMWRIHDKVNIIPVIGKADACTKEEMVLLKKKR
jgi:septin family protein